MFPERAAMNKQGGFGLPAAIFVITVLALVVAGISAIIARSSESVSLKVQSQRSFYAAESGVQLALNLLLPPSGASGQSCSVAPFYSQSFSVSGLVGCRVQVSCRSVVDGSQLFYILASTGQCGSGHDASVRTIEVMVQ